MKAWNPDVLRFAPRQASDTGRTEPPHALERRYVPAKGKKVYLKDYTTDSSKWTTREEALRRHGSAAYVLNGSGIGVVDFDDLDHPDARRMLRRMREEDTCTVITAAGKPHFVFTIPPHITKGWKLPWGDFKVKGHVVAPGSVVDGGRYEVENEAPLKPLPDYFVDYLRHLEVERSKETSLGDGWVNSEGPSGSYWGGGTFDPSRLSPRRRAELEQREAEKALLKPRGIPHRELKDGRRLRTSLVHEVLRIAPGRWSKKDEVVRAINLAAGGRAVTKKLLTRRWLEPEDKWVGGERSYVYLDCEIDWEVVRSHRRRRNRQRWRRTCRRHGRVRHCHRTTVRGNHGGSLIIPRSKGFLFLGQGGHQPDPEPEPPP